MVETSIAFAEARVVVRSDVPEVHEAMRRDFVHMLTDDTRPPIAVLGIRREQGTFVLEGAAFNPIRYADLKHLLFLLKDEVRLEFMRSRPDLLWIHAGAVECRGLALLLVGKSGQGKSTLATLLAATGWRMMSDDVAPISMNTDHVYPFPQTPARRIPSTSEWNDLTLSSAPREVVTLPHSLIRYEPAEIRWLIFPSFERGAAASLEPLSKGQAALEFLRAATNFCDHKSAAVERAARLGGSAAAYRCTYSSAIDAAHLVDTLKHG